MILEFVTDRNDSFASLPVIPVPPSLSGAVNIQEQPEHGPEQLIKRRKGSTLTESLILLPELPLIDICVFGLYHSAYQGCSERLGSTRDAVRGRVTCWGFLSVLLRTWLAFERKRK